MSNIQLVLTDFDGTVAEFGKHVVSEKVREAVIACENAGIRMVPVTGRYYGMAQSVLEVLGFEDLGVFDNGATIQNCKTGEIVWSKWLELETLQQVASVLAPASARIDYSQYGYIHVPADDEQDIIRRLTDTASCVYALVNAEFVAEVSEQLNAIPGITFYAAASTIDELPSCIGIQVNHIEADKFHGVNALREIIGVPQERTLAIGDGDNDVALFKNAGLKIAMGNATELLKAQADHIVSSVKEDGFAEAMQRFVLDH